MAHQRTWPPAVRECQLATDNFLNIGRIRTYGAANRTLMGGLALHGEGDAIGSFGLDLNAGCHGSNN